MMERGGRSSRGRVEIGLRRESVGDCNDGVG